MLRIRYRKNASCSCTNFGIPTFNHTTLMQEKREQQVPCQQLQVFYVNYYSRNIAMFSASKYSLHNYYTNSKQHIIHIQNKIHPDSN